MTLPISFVMTGPIFMHLKFLPREIKKRWKRVKSNICWTMQGSNIACTNHHNLHEAFFDSCTFIQFTIPSCHTAKHLMPCATKSSTNCCSIELHNFLDMPTLFGVANAVHSWAHKNTWSTSMSFLWTRSIFLVREMHGHCFVLIGSAFFTIVCWVWICTAKALMQGQMVCHLSPCLAMTLLHLGEWPQTIPHLFCHTHLIVRRMIRDLWSLWD